MAVSKADLVKVSAARLDSLVLTGSWRNELGSIMTITSVNGAAFSGTYQSVDSQGGQVIGTLSGTVAGDTIGFVVNWQPTYDSETSRAGKFASVGNAVYIYALWYLAGGEADTPLWQSFTAGADLFWPVNQAGG